MQNAETTVRIDPHLVGIAWFRFAEGRAEEFERLSRQCLDIVRTQDMGTLEYDVYLSQDRSEAIVVERYQDSAALLVHLANIGEELMTAVASTGTVRGVLLGTPSDQIVASLEGGPVRIFAPAMSL